MANSQYEYVKAFETHDELLPHCWIVCRIDGIGFTKFTASHRLEKPNDRRCMNVMNASAKAVMATWPGDIVLSIGMSDEYSFVLQPFSKLYGRRASKISSAIVSTFTSAFVFHWAQHFPHSPLTASNLPSFDSRVVLYPTDAAVKDYVRWRQVDAHINNLYNTTFWKLVRELQGVPVVHPKEQQQQQPQQQHLQDGASPNGLSEREAREQAHALMHSHYASSAEKNEVLFSRFHCNYNDEPAEFRKGTILVWKEMPPAAVAIAAADAQRRAESQASSGAAAAAAEAEQATPKASSPAPSPRVVWQLHCDVISDEFWTSNFPGIVPYAGAPGHERKQQKKEEKKAKRQAYRERDAKERNNAQQQQQQQQKQQTNASAGAAVAAPSAVPSAAAAAAAAAAVPNGVPHQTSSHATAPLPTANATAVERPPPSLDAKAGEGRQQQQKQQTNAGGQVS